MTNREYSLVKAIHWEDDERITKAAASGDADFVSSPQAPNMAITLGDVVAGADGNAYLMRRTNPTIVYVISPASEVLRRLSLDPGNAGMFRRGFMMLEVGWRSCIRSNKRSILCWRILRQETLLRAVTAASKSETRLPVRRTRNIFS
jgi:hypothetical protein